MPTVNDFANPYVKNYNNDAGPECFLQFKWWMENVNWEYKRIKKKYFESSEAQWGSIILIHLQQTPIIELEDKFEKISTTFRIQDLLSNCKSKEWIKTTIESNYFILRIPESTEWKCHQDYKHCGNRKHGNTVEWLLLLEDLTVEKPK